MNREAEFKTRLVAQCRAKGAYAIRCEDRYALGRLDATIKFPGDPRTLLVEGKIFHHQSFAPTPRQFLEGSRYMSAGGLCALIGWSVPGHKMYVHPWAETATRAASFHSERGDWAEQLMEWLRGA